MNTNESKNLVLEGMLAFSLLFGIAIISSTTARAQGQQGEQGQQGQQGQHGEQGQQGQHGEQGQQGEQGQHGEQGQQGQQGEQGQHGELGQFGQWGPDGEVTSADEDTRQFTLRYKKGDMEQTFVGVLPKGYKARMKDGGFREVKMAELVGMRVKPYYTARTKKVNDQKIKTNEVFKIRFLAQSR